MKFRAPCSAAGPKLGDYSQWVRRRAPTEKSKEKQSQNKAYPDGRSRCQMRLGAVLEGVTLGSQLRLDVQKRLVQRAVPPPRTHPTGAALVASASGMAELAATVSSWRGAEVAFSRRRRAGKAT